jgi:hypothetical protein
VDGLSVGEGLFLVVEFNWGGLKRAVLELRVVVLLLKTETSSLLRVGVESITEWRSNTKSSSSPGGKGMDVDGCWAP